MARDGNYLQIGRRACTSAVEYDEGTDHVTKDYWIDQTTQELRAVKEVVFEDLPTYLCILSHHVKEPI